MAFTNTVETVGDAALTRSIIDRSITELNDNISVSIRQQAFRACSALASVNFPNVTNVGLGAFWQCTALTKAEFSACVTFANNAFYGCTALSALILRCTDQLCTITGTPFAGSAIANGTGYIYVPAVLVDQYKASWTAYAAQVRAIEDYPEVVDPYSWVAVAKALDNGTYASVYKVGDLVPLDLGDEGIVNMQIVAFDVDDLADGSGKASISWISKELLGNKKTMNNTAAANGDGSYQEGTGHIGGWKKCAVRTYLAETILPLIPEDVQSLIKTVTKYGTSYDANNSIVKNAETTDNVWLPSAYEITASAGSTVETLGPSYASFFTDLTSRKKIPLGVSTSQDWWLRSATYESVDSFYCITSGGYLSGADATLRKYVPLGFCT